MIHPHTYIHPNTKLAPNVKIDPFSVIHQDVEIGEGTWKIAGCPMDGGQLLALGGGRFGTVYAALSVAAGTAGAAIHFLI